MSGTFEQLWLPSAFAHPLQVTLWTPHGLDRHTAAPILWCHDGSGYEHHTSLTPWMSERIESGVLPPVRVVLHDAHRRSQIYSGSPRYLTTFSKGITSLHQTYGVSAVAVMGSSLGGLTSLAVGIRDTRVSAVLTESGSFFQPRTDRQESGFRWFDRIGRQVEHLGGLPETTARQARDRLTIAFTCGLDEQNLANNEAMASRLQVQGFDVRIQWLPGGHNFDSWRLALDPLWSGVLREALGAQGWAA